MTICRKGCNAANVEALVASWIEIPGNGTIIKLLSSKPLWLRGLKLQIFGLRLCHRRSKPLWLRGLKSIGQAIGSGHYIVEALVASWIEIFLLVYHTLCNYVEALVASWIEINTSTLRSTVCIVEALVASWIEIASSSTISSCLNCRSPCGFVD